MKPSTLVPMKTDTVMGGSFLWRRSGGIIRRKYARRREGAGDVPRIGINAVAATQEPGTGTIYRAPTQARPTLAKTARMGTRACCTPAALRRSRLEAGGTKLSARGAVGGRRHKWPLQIEGTIYRAPTRSAGRFSAWRGSRGRRRGVRGRRGGWACRRRCRCGSGGAFRRSCRERRRFQIFRGAIGKRLQDRGRAGGGGRRPCRREGGNTRGRFASRGRNRAGRDWR